MEVLLVPVEGCPVFEMYPEIQTILIQKLSALPSFHPGLCQGS
jgi:hypothetical protein